MTTPTVTETRRNGNAVGERVELGRYCTNAGEERVVYGQRIATVVRVTDVPDHRKAARTSSSAGSRRTATPRCLPSCATTSSRRMSSERRPCRRRPSNSADRRTTPGQRDGIGRRQPRTQRLSHNNRT